MSRSCQPWKIFRWEKSSTQNESGREENEEKKKEDAVKEHSKKLNREDVPPSYSLVYPVPQSQVRLDGSGSLLSRLLYIQN